MDQIVPELHTFPHPYDHLLRGVISPCGVNICPSLSSKHDATLCITYHSFVKLSITSISPRAISIHVLSNIKLDCVNNAGTSNSPHISPPNLWLSPFSYWCVSLDTPIPIFAYCFIFLMYIALACKMLSTTFYFFASILDCNFWILSKHALQS